MALSRDFAAERRPVFVPSGRPAADGETLAFTQERKRAQRERDFTRR